MDLFMNGHPTYVNLECIALTSLDLSGEFINEPIRERVSIFIKILWVIKYTINYGPIREWVLASNYIHNNTDMI